MKFLLPLISFLIGNAGSFFKEPRQAITQQVILHIRSITILAVSAIGSLALACVGVSLLIANLAGQLDATTEFHFTYGTYLYLAMTLFFGGVLFWTLRRDTWLKAVGFQEKQQAAKKGNVLENALALIVMDFLEERQHRRQGSGPKN